MLMDELLPAYDFNEVHSAEVAAAADIVYGALFTFDMGKPLIVRTLMGIRSIPTWMKGSHRSRDRRPLTLAEAGRAGFTLLAADPPREVVLGIQGQFWKLSPNTQSVTAAEFRAPLPADIARAAWNFFVEPIGPTRCVLSTETRILCGDAESRRRFGFYWKIIRPGSGIIRHAMLAAVKDEAVRASRLSRSTPRTPSGTS
jgi:hypothetical protein